MALKEKTIPSRISNLTAPDAETIKDCVNADDDLDLIKSNDIKNNFLSQMVEQFINQGTNLDEIPDDHGEMITLQDIINETNNFILAGFDTTRTTILWLLNCLASEPTIQKRVYDELIEVFGSPNDEWVFDLENLNQLKYLDACIRETLRLFPALVFIGRNSDSQSIQLDENARIPTNTDYLVSVYSVHHDETIYPDPDKFDPDRWLNERGQSIPSNCFIPFGIGPRACVGYRFAMYELMIVTASIIKNFEIKTDRHYDVVEWTFAYICRPLDQVKFQLKPRKLTIK